MAKADEATKSAQLEQIDGATIHSINLFRVSASLRGKAIGALNALEAELVKKLLQAGNQTSAQNAKFAATIKGAQQTIAEYYAKAAKETDGGLKEIAAIEAKKSADLVNLAVGIEVFPPFTTPEILESLVNENLIFGYSSRQWWKAQSEALQSKFQREMTNGVLLNETVDDLVRRVRGTKAADYKDGIMEASRREAEALVRSSVATVSNAARLRSFEENADVIKGIQWVSTLDGRTTHTCKALDGKQWRLPDYQPIGHDKKFPGPVAHWNCRSTQIAVTRSWDELTDKPIKALDGKTLEAAVRDELKKQGKAADAAGIIKGRRASMDGEVDLQSFEEWASTKNDEFLNRILGPGRFKLYNAGKITMSQLTDQNNRPLTVAQLRELVDSGQDTSPPETFDFTQLTKAELAALAAGSTSQTAATFLESYAALSPTHAKLVDGFKEGNDWESLDVAEIEKGLSSEASIQVIQSLSDIQLPPDLAVPKGSTKLGHVLALGGIDPNETGIVPKLAAIEKAKAKIAAVQALDSKLNAMSEPWFPGVFKNELNAALDAAGDDEALKQKVVSAAKAKLKEAQAVIDAHEVTMIDVAASFESSKTDTLAAADEFAIIGFKLPPTLKTEIDGAVSDHYEQMTKLFDGKIAQIEKLQKIKAAPAGTPEAKAVTFFENKELYNGPPPSLEAVEAKVEQIKSATSNAKTIGIAKAGMVKKGVTDPLAYKGGKGWEAIKGDLDPVTLAEIKAEVEAKLAAAQLPAASTALDVDVKNLDHKLPPASALQKKKVLGGSNAAELAEDPATGKLYVVKSGAKGQTEAEVMVDAVYRAAGARVPASWVDPDGVKVAEFVPDAKTLGSVGNITVELDAEVQLGKHFVLDALLDNFDVIGTGQDNVLVDAGGRAWRIDNGGSLTFRAMGAKKPFKGDDISSIDSMRDKKVNANTARVFGALTDEDIKAQVSELYEARERIFAPLDEKSRAVVLDRLDLLRARYGVPDRAERRAATRRAAPTSFVTEGTASAVVRARSNGYWTPFDTEDIEDAGVLTWTRKRADGSPVTMTEFKVRPGGWKKIQAATQLETIAKPSAGSAARPSDPPYVALNKSEDFNGKAISMAKTLGKHLSDGQFNPHTVAAFEGAHKKLKGLVSSDDPAVAEMAKAHLVTFDKLAAEFAAKQAPSQIALTGPDLTAAAAAHAKAVASVPKPAIKPPKAEWEVTHGSNWDFTYTTFSKGDQTETTGSNNVEASWVGGVYTLKRGRVSVRVVPAKNIRAGGKYETGKALAGKVEITVDGAPSEDTLRETEAVMRDLGLQIEPRTPEFEEALYLSKIAHKAGAGRDIKDRDKDAEAIMKEFRKKTGGIEAARAKAKEIVPALDFNAKDYDPAGTKPPFADATGFVHHYDPTLDREELNRKYVLSHEPQSSLNELMEHFVTQGGWVTPTTERVRKGIPINSGASPWQDLQSGGASFFFTRIRDEDFKANATKPIASRPRAARPQYILFKGELAARTDTQSYPKDVYGAQYSQARNIESPRDKWDSLAADHSNSNEFTLKNGADLFRDVDVVVLGTESARQEVLAMLRRNGYDRWPDGRALEDVIIP